MRSAAQMIMDACGHHLIVAVLDLREKEGERTEFVLKVHVVHRITAVRSVLIEAVAARAVGRRWSFGDLVCATWSFGGRAQTSCRSLSSHTHERTHKHTKLAIRQETPMKSCRQQKWRHSLNRHHGFVRQSFARAFPQHTFPSAGWSHAPIEPTHMNCVLLCL